jgi:hypothetical protein
MWGLILLFVLVTPGILFTVPRIGKTKLLAICVHALIFVVLAQLLRMTEGFAIKGVVNLQKKNVVLSDETKENLRAHYNLIQENTDLYESYAAGNIDEDSYHQRTQEIAAEMDTLKTTIKSNLVRDAGDFTCEPGTYIVYPSSFFKFSGYSLSCKKCVANSYCPGGVSLPLKCPTNTKSLAGATSIDDCKGKQYPVFNIGDKVRCANSSTIFTVGKNTPTSVDPSDPKKTTMSIYRERISNRNKVSVTWTTAVKSKCQLVTPEVTPEVLPERPPLVVLYRGEDSQKYETLAPESSW